MPAREVGVWLDGEKLAVLKAKRPGRITCRYTDLALTRWLEGTPVLSCSLPLAPRGLEAFAFVSGLLPEGQHRQAMAALARVPTTDVLGMLERFGRDVAGAISIGRHELSAREPYVEAYSDDSLLEAVGSLGEHPLGLYDDTELSIAGLQDKMLVVESGDGGLGRPVNGYPSTHILKLDNRIFPGLVRAEHRCLELARTAGIPAAESRLLSIGAIDCILVKRFDRVMSTDGSVARIHQEDACQALGIDPERNQRRAKYQAFGGPSFKDVAELLGAWGADPDAQLIALLEQLVFTVLIGNADAHGKNVALLHTQIGEIALAPLYDTVPTRMWPTLRGDAAMSIGGATRLASVTVADIVQETAAWPMSAGRARSCTESVVTRMIEATGSDDDLVSASVRTRAEELTTSL